mmetsp:Transcript_7406/g.10382  ORF Transcript_7406/g.10382 Transcript_7406/m.10382 type:complete len:90 (+) Transcript_7406:331-600(+)
MHSIESFLEGVVLPTGNVFQPSFSNKSGGPPCLGVPVIPHLKEFSERSNSSTSGNKASGKSPNGSMKFLFWYNGAFSVLYQSMNSLAML